MAEVGLDRLLAGLDRLCWRLDRLYGQSDRLIFESDRLSSPAPKRRLFWCFSWQLNSPQATSNDAYCRLPRKYCPLLEFYCPHSMKYCPLFNKYCPLPYFYCPLPLSHTAASLQPHKKEDSPRGVILFLIMIHSFCLGFSFFDECFDFGFHAFFISCLRNNDADLV